MCPDRSDDVLGRILAADVDQKVMRALSTREQRYVAYHLLDHEQATLDELADVLAGRVAAVERRVTTRSDRESLRTALYHTHLPQMRDAGLIVFDPVDGVVDRSPLSGGERDLIAAAYLAEQNTPAETEP